MDNRVYAYDWEVYPNYSCVTFIDLATPPNLIEDYIEYDILYLKYRNIKDRTEEEEEMFQKCKKIKALILEEMNVFQFEMYKDMDYPSRSVNDAGKLYQFYMTHKTTFGFNSHKFDAVLTDAFLNIYPYFQDHNGMSKGKVFLTSNVGLENIHITRAMKMLSDDIIFRANSGEWFTEYPWRKKYYKRPFRDFDIQKITYLDKSFTGLKSVAINLRWHRIQELPLPIDTIINLQTRYEILDYNVNDTLITLTLVNDNRDELKLRDDISNYYGIDVRNDSRSSIGKRLMTKFYSEYSGLKPRQFSELRTFRTRIKLGNIIDDKIKFITPYFNSFLEDLKNTTVGVATKFTKYVRFNSTTYTMAKGGLHSIDDSAIFDNEDGYLYVDADVTSYYPSILILFGIFPEHLDKDIFLAIVSMLKNDRVDAKSLCGLLEKQVKRLEAMEIEAMNDDERKLFATIDEAMEYIAELKLRSEALKIVINRIYGALNDQHDYLCDAKATYSVTMNGQLSLLMLIESIELNDMKVVSANTDGFVTKMKPEQYERYKEICNAWCNYTEFELEYTEYERYVRTNVNNYVSVKKGFKEAISHVDLDAIKKSGDFSSLKHIEKMYVKLKGNYDDKISYSSGFIHPVVSTALKRFALYGVPTRETISHHITTSKTAIFDYCISYKVAKKFDVIAKEMIKGEIVETKLQQYNRMFVVKHFAKGIAKEDLFTNKKDVTVHRSQSLVAGANLELINDYFEDEKYGGDYNLDYGFYNKVIDTILYFRKKNTKGNHKGEGIMVRGNTLFGEQDLRMNIDELINPDHLYNESELIRLYSKYYVELEEEELEYD